MFGLYTFTSTNKVHGQDWHSGTMPVLAMHFVGRCTFTQGDKVFTL